MLVSKLSMYSMMNIKMMSTMIENHHTVDGFLSSLHFGRKANAPIRMSFTDETGNTQEKDWKRIITNENDEAEVRLLFTDGSEYSLSEIFSAEQLAVKIDDNFREKMYADEQSNAEMFALPVGRFN